MDTGLTAALALYLAGSGIFTFVFATARTVKWWRKRAAGRDATHRAESRANLDRALSNRTGFGYTNPDTYTKPGHVRAAAGGDRAGAVRTDDAAAAAVNQYRNGSHGIDSQPGPGSVRGAHTGNSAVADILSREPRRADAPPVMVPDVDGD